MANEIIFREGFDTYNGLGSNVGVLSKWTRINANETSLVAGRFGGQALQTDNDSISNRQSHYRQMDAAVSEFALGVAIRATTVGMTANASSHLRLNQGASTFQVGIRLNMDRSISVVRQDAYNSQTVLGTSSGAVWDNSTWFYLEWEGLLSNTVGESRLYINGNPTPALNLSGVDTINTDSTVSFVDLGVATNTNTGLQVVAFDDMYVKQGATRLGPQKISTLRVNGNSTPQDFVPSTGSDHAAMVDETLANTTDWVAGNTVGDIDQFLLDNISGYPAAIHEVNVIAYARSSDAMTRAIEFGIQSNSVDEVLEWYLSNSWARKDLPVPLNPDGSAAWDRDAINALKARLKVTV